jgi:hypothetical protein
MECPTVCSRVSVPGCVADARIVPDAAGGGGGDTNDDGGDEDEDAVDASVVVVNDEMEVNEDIAAAATVDAAPSWLDSLGSLINVLTFEPSFKPSCISTVVKRTNADLDWVQDAVIGNAIAIVNSARPAVIKMIKVNGRQAVVDFKVCFV